MAITSSAKKAYRVAQRKHVFNMRRKSELDKQIKSFRRLVAAKDKAGAEKLVSSVYKALDKAAKTGYIKANTSSRLKSRAMAALNKLAK